MTVHYAMGLQAAQARGVYSSWPRKLKFSEH